MKSPDRPAKKPMSLNDSFINEVKQIVEQARREAYTAINSAMVKHIGKWANASWKKNNRGKRVPIMGNNC